MALGSGTATLLAAWIALADARFAHVYNPVALPVIFACTAIGLPCQCLFRRSLSMEHRALWDNVPL